MTSLRETKRLLAHSFRRTPLTLLDVAFKYEEVSDLVSSEVAAKLDPTKAYGIWWFNRRRTRRVQVSEPSPNGRLYRKRGRVTTKQKDEWIAVPVPAADIPREWVDAAREAIRNNRRPSSAGHRFWELSGGIFRCGGCGRSMYTNSVKPARGQYYYRCASRLHNGADVCSVSKNYRADEVEPAVWRLVSDLLKDPDLVRTGLEVMIRQERGSLRGDPDTEVEAWALKLAEVDNMRSGYQEMAAKGLMTFEELGARLKELDNTRETAEREMKALQSRKNRIEELERDREDLLRSYAGVMPQALDVLEPEERYQVYKMLSLSVAAHPDRSVTVSGVLGNSIKISNAETTSSSC